jgi:putative ABC transport system ATP-binding protein
MMLDIQQLHLTFNRGTPIENRVLRGVNLKIEKGEFVTVIGSNGAGKSTLLNTISGDFTPDHGLLNIGGVNVLGQSTHERAKRVARVFQDPLAGTCEALTVEENMALAMMRGHRRGFKFALNTQRREFLRDKLAMLRLGLENRLTDRMGLLSGGQRQAVSLLIASLTPSDILLLDEHTAALDPKAAADVLGLTKTLVDAGQMTTLMVTHSMRQALDHGTRTIMLHEGRVILDVCGEVRQRLDVPDLLQLFAAQAGSELDDDKLLLGKN